jgi:hypothetical protein
MKKPLIDRITVTLADDLVKGIDRLEKNRSKFVAEAVRREIDRRRRAEFQLSLRNPHPESTDLASQGPSQGMDDWAGMLSPDDDVSDLLDPAAGSPVQWVAGQGWIAESRGEDQK